MKREIRKTADGSTTIYLTEWDENYHSKHGAIQEAMHVFIKNGLGQFDEGPVSIMEIGFGTGLNALLTLLEGEKRMLPIEYTGIEGFPVTTEEISSMNYVAALGGSVQDQQWFHKIHASEWESACAISPLFTLTKRKQLFADISDREAYDLIYFDAFGYRVQPELWSTEIFRAMYHALRPGGILVTYAARGVVKRSMIEVGFTVEKLDGPPGKREMFRARKTNQEV